LDKIAKRDRSGEIESGSFQDPAKKGWVWGSLIALFIGMTPFWPITGTMWGYPRWVIFAVFMSFLASVFIATVILFVWKDSESKKNEPSQNT
jgi:hypothetical protein